ncbi:hypothetical protein [Leifsonia shinshuensis]|uniref:hypothetical protein n=1 Tax=Leifsonia shinshuensis TaxID=150026 RepID=UPI0035E91227
MAMWGASITWVVLIATFVWSSVDGGWAGLSVVVFGWLVAMIVGIASAVISVAALATGEPPRWMAITALIISVMPALLCGLLLGGR